MRRRLFLVISIVFLMFITSIAQAKPTGSVIRQCPQSINLIKTNNIEGLPEALNRIIPQLYPEEERSEWKEWKIIYISPLSGTGYYEMGKKYCGEEVANKSWFVQLQFPKLLPSESLSQGQIFVAKDKEKGWFAWFQYR